MEFKKCDICQEEYKEMFITPHLLRIGEPLGHRIGNDYMEPIELNICINCKENRKKDIINKFKSLLLPN